jgi:predicted DNA-binding transcriptional regulator YafY
VSQKSSLYRTIEILKLLNEGKKLCITNLSYDYGVSDRTIRRDFELIRTIFGDFMSKDGECYRAYKKTLLEDVLRGTDFMVLANIVNLFGEASMQNSISLQTSALVKKSLSIYDFKSRPIESVKNRTFIKTIEHSIKFHKEINLEYKVSRGSTKRVFQPYKILFVNENFYLVGENISKNSFEFLRLSLILDVKDTKNSFFPRKDIVEFITKIQTPWAVFGKEEIVVKLRIFQKNRKYFILKKYLPSQEIVQTFENGDIEVHFRVHNLREIEELVIKWLPNVTIISPRNLNKMIKRVLKKKMQEL